MKILELNTISRQQRREEKKKIGVMRFGSRQKKMRNGPKLKREQKKMENPDRQKVQK